MLDRISGVLNGKLNLEKLILIQLNGLIKVTEFRVVFKGFVDKNLLVQQFALKG